MIKNIKSQMEEHISSHSNILADYGALGFLVILLLFLIQKLWQWVQRQHEANAKRITDLEEYVTNDRKTLIEAVQRCATVIERNNEVLDMLAQQKKN